ncbi:MAG TPA: hypothetical protein VM513_08345 [Kofleriaceae bacterium]|jgi:hypothetical protein|nr:hypothetical protein [Kofleriaceae bacterium]
MALTGPEHRRLLDKLTREVLRVEGQVVDQPGREARRLGDVPPVAALRDIASHAAAMRSRFEAMVAGYGLVLHRFGVGALTTLRYIVLDRVVDAERSYRTALAELRHGIEVVKVLRDAARRDELFGMIRWCDDWSNARRTLVARAEAQLAWFSTAEEAPTVPSASSSPRDDDDPLAWHSDRNTSSQVRPRDVRAGTSTSSTSIVEAFSGSDDATHDGEVT